MKKRTMLLLSATVFFCLFLGCTNKPDKTPEAKEEMPKESTAPYDENNTSFPSVNILEAEMNSLNDKATNNSDNTLVAACRFQILDPSEKVIGLELLFVEGTDLNIAAKQTKEIMCSLSDNLGLKKSTEKYYGQLYDEYSIDIIASVRTEFGNTEFIIECYNPKEAHVDILLHNEISKAGA